MHYIDDEEKEETEEEKKVINEIPILSLLLNNVNSFA